MDQAEFWFKMIVAKHCTYLQRVISGSKFLFSSKQWTPAECYISTTSSAGYSRFQRSVELTSVRYPNVKRGNYGQITAADVARFNEIMPDASRVLTDPQEIDGYNTDWMGIYKGSGQIVLRPKTTDEVSKILKYCNERRLAVVPQGGNTGLVGGSVPLFDEVIISTRLMNNIINVDATAGVLVCQSGCILEQLNEYLQNHDLMMPLDLGSKGSCNIGGNVSTNAGGIRLMRYGSLHGSVLGLEAVTADGQVIDCLSSLRKDNVGYHTKNWFIGSEGTLGIVTAVSVFCPRRPTSINLAFLGCDSFDKVLKTLSVAQTKLNEILSAFEFMDDLTMNVSTRHLKTTCPIKSAPFYVLVETSGSNSEHDESKLNAFLETVMATGLVMDGTVASQSSHIKSIWHLRESVAAGLLDDGHCYKYDISLPHIAFYEIVEVMRKKLAGITTTVCGYGHVADGNLHFNATSKEFDRDVLNTIEPFLYEYVAKFRGSISAEHGIGFSKRKYIEYGRPEPVVNLMKKMKGLLDPNAILNPYKVLPL